MPAQDTKITALAAITTVDPANDMLPIVDVSDNSMAASGTTKRITSNQILGAGGTATLASATITGAATVGTTLGVTGASTLASASVTGALGAAGLNVTGATIPANGVYLGSANSLSFSAASTLGMTMNATGLGVGVVGANGIKLSSFVTTDGAPATSGTTQSSGSLRIGAASTTGAMDMGTAGSYSWIQVLDRGNLATNYDLALQPNGGNLLVGATAAGGQNGFCVLRPLSAGVVATTTETAHNFGALTGTTYATFLYATTAIGSITQNGTTGVLYNTTSDYRLKESVKPISGGLARVNALKPSVYNWKSDGSTGEGFLAHELAEVVPAAVSGEKDAVNADGSIKSQGIDMSRIVPILVAAIQELTAEVNALKKA